MEKPIAPPDMRQAVGWMLMGLGGSTAGAVGLYLYLMLGPQRYGPLPPEFHPTNRVVLIMSLIVTAGLAVFGLGRWMVNYARTHPSPS